MRRNLIKKIVQVLENNKGNVTQPILTIEDIAKEIFGIGYMKETAILFEKKIKNAMYAVEDLMQENDIVLVKKKIPTKNGTKKFRIEGYKVGEEGDEGYIVDDLQTKKDAKESYINSSKSLAKNAIDQKIISTEKAKQLTD